jgi:hypothetical protein
LILLAWLEGGVGRAYTLLDDNPHIGRQEMPGRMSAETGMRVLILGTIAAVASLSVVQLGAAGAVAKTPTVFIVRGPTVVAFFPPVSDSELDSDADLNETLSDFQYYADEVRGPFKRAGIEFHETYTRSFLIRMTGKAITFRATRKNDVGYYFIAPGKKPHVEYDVMTDEELLDVAHDYFGIAIPDDSQDVAREFASPLN